MVRCSFFVDRSLRSPGFSHMSSTSELLNTRCLCYNLFEIIHFYCKLFTLSSFMESKVYSDWHLERRGAKMNSEGFQPPQNNYPPPPYNNPQFSYQPGQFQPPRPPQKRRSIRQWFSAQRRIAKVGLGCGSIFLVFMLCICSLAAYGSTLPPQKKAQPSPDTNSTLGQIATTATTPTDQPIIFLSPTATPNPTPKPTATPTPKPTATPTLKPTPRPASKPTPKPTQPPKPTTCPGVNCNPWGYNFSPGDLIYSPNPDFCAYFSCINNFWNGRGYVNECNDGMYSKSGGIRGDCSHHHGEMRPLYSH